jgi:hypothetical protein
MQPKIRTARWRRRKKMEETEAKGAKNLHPTVPVVVYLGT